MNRVFIETALFQKQWHQLGLGEQNLEDLQTLILSDPEGGDMIEGTGGLRKLRFRFPGRGKRGSCRVCYIDFSEFAKTYLLTVYAKKNQESLTNREKQLLRVAVKTLRDEARRNYYG